MGKEYSRRSIIIIFDVIYGSPVVSGGTGGECKKGLTARAAGNGMDKL